MLHVGIIKVENFCCSVSKIMITCVFRRYMTVNVFCKIFKKYSPIAHGIRLVSVLFCSLFDSQISFIWRSNRNLHRNCRVKIVYSLNRSVTLFWKWYCTYILDGSQPSFKKSSMFAKCMHWIMNFFFNWPHINMNMKIFIYENIKEKTKQKPWANPLPTDVHLSKGFSSIQCLCLGCISLISGNWIARRPLNTEW